MQTIAKIIFKYYKKVQLLELMEDLVHQRKKCRINFSKTNTKCYLSLHYNHDNSYSFVNGKKKFIFKTGNKNVNFPNHFCLGTISNGSFWKYMEVYLSIFRWKYV